MLRKRSKSEKYHKFISLLKQFSANIPLVEALEKMHSYANFMKNLGMKNRILSFNPYDSLHHYSKIVSHSLMQKKKYPRTYTIQCTIEAFNFAKALYELGTIINLIWLVVLR